MKLKNEFVGESEIRSQLYSRKGADSSKQEVYDNVNNKGSSKAQANKFYDREAILYKLANLADVDILKYVMNDEKEDTDDVYLQSRIGIIRKALHAVPDSLLHIMTGLGHPVDCGPLSNLKPDWFDEEKLRRGQKFAQDHIFSVFYAELISALALYSFEDSIKPFIITGKSATPFVSFKRYVSLAVRFRNWFTQDLWSEGTTAVKDFRVVRSMHAAVRRRLEAMTNEEIDAATRIPNAWCPAREILLKDFSEACEAPAIGQCPYIGKKNDPNGPRGLNQAEMALSQWCPVGLLVSYPKSFGIHDATDEDLEAYGYLWRTIGYQLGIEDEFNFCRGTLEDIRHRSQDFIETWVKPNFRVITREWEHIMRCLVTGTSVILPLLSYEIGLLHLTEILGLQMPSLYDSLSYKDWTIYNLLRFLLNHSIKLPGMLRLVNFVMNYALDRAAKFNPKELEAVQIELSKYPEIRVKLNS